MQRTATWVCRWCPAADQLLAPGPHYRTPDDAEAWLRHHVLTEHAALLWDTAGRTSFGHVLEYAVTGA